MTQKFGRTYRLTIYPIDGGDPIIITLPLTINFTAKREINSSVNSLDIDIYNLSDAHRKRIYQDRNVIGQYFNDQKNPDGFPTASFNILLEAGYAPGFGYRVFYGKMLWASSAREGTNIITRIQCTGGQLDINGTDINATLPAGSTLGAVITYLCNQFPNLTIGQIADYPQIFTRPVVLSGNAWRLLQKYSAGNAYIDGGKIYVIGHKDVLNNSFVINDATGILNTPRPQAFLITLTTLLETGINTMGQQVQVASTVLPQVNGNYKVIGIRHQGMISAAICGKATSTFLLQSATLYNGFTVLPAQ